MAAELGLPLRHIKKHFDRITARFANVDRVDPQRIMVCELRACMDAWYSGNTSQPNADSLKDRPRTAKDWQELFTFLNNLPQIMQEKYPNNNPLAGLSIDENNKLDPKDIEFMALTYGGADTNDEETRQKLAKIHFKPFQEILRADTNREILAVDQENDAVHSVKVFLDQLCDLCLCTSETQTVFADHYHRLLLGTWGHDQDEFPGELGTAGDQYTKNGAAKPEIHLDTTEAYWKLLKTTTGASLTEKTEKRLFPLLKAYDRWKKTETEIVRQLASTLGIKTKSLKEVLEKFNDLDESEQNSLFANAFQQAIDTILNKQDTDRVDLALALIIKIADRRHNQDEHTITGLLRHFWCPPHKMPQAFNGALLDTINQGTPKDAKAGERISSAENATSKAKSERPIRHPSNPTAWIEASPEAIPLLKNYLSQVVDNAAAVLGGLKDQKQRTAFIHLFRVMRDSVERIEDRVASTQEKRDHLFDWRGYAKNLTTAGIIGQTAGITGTVFSKAIEAASTVLAHPLTAQDISHFSQQVQWAGTLGTLWPMLQNALKDRSCMQFAATALNALVVGQMCVAPDQVPALIPTLLFGNAAFMFGRMRDQLIPANREDVAKITDIPAAFIDETKRSGQFLKESLTHFPEDIKILSQYLAMTLQGHVPDSDKETKLRSDNALKRVSGLMNLAQLPGDLFPNNPVYAGMRGFGELFDGIARGIEGKKNHNWFWQVSAGIMTISRLCMTASPLLGEHQQGTFDAGQLMLTASFVFFSLGLQQAVQGKDRH
ncbi:MAG: hypothetical protein ACK5UY_04825 [Holosporales bacterium]